MKLKSAIFCWLVPLGLTLSHEPTPQETQMLNAKLDGWLEVAAGISPTPSDEELSELSLGVWKLSHSFTYPIERRKDVFVTVQRKLLSTPGHAEFLSRRIRQARTLWREGRRNEVKGGPGTDFETLALLPSAETVHALGSFLDDEEGKSPERPTSDVSLLPSNNLLATRAFAGLGLSNPPLHKKPDEIGYDDIQPWKLWFAQVQGGNRTFRFEGDPNEYNLAGPINEPRPSKDGPTTGTGPKDPLAKATDTQEKASRLPTWWLTLAGVLLVLAIWCATRRKPAAA